jgi:hypothetical protein
VYIKLTVSGQKIGQCNFVYTLELTQLFVEIHNRGCFRRLEYVYWMDHVAKSDFDIKKRSIFNLLKLACYRPFKPFMPPLPLLPESAQKQGQDSILAKMLI